MVHGRQQSLQHYRQSQDQNPLEWMHLLVEEPLECKEVNVLSILGKISAVIASGNGDK